MVSAAFNPDDVLIQWMPHHHDMGLFGHLSQILNGADSHVFEPMELLRRPAGLLRYFAEHRATVFTGVNFAYDLLLDAVEKEGLARLDLSAWRLAFSGAEPVSAVTVRRFQDLLGPAGVAPHVMYPVYGLAEATLPVTFPEPGTVPRIVTIDRHELGSRHTIRQVPAGHRHAKTAVSVGRPVDGVRVRLVDNHGHPLTAGRLGELQVRGDSVTSGYLNDMRATAGLFDDGWLRTGDLGFRLDADYFVVGRAKEMIIVHGQNYFPEDAEVIARETPGVYRRHAVAVAENDDGHEYLSVIAETKLKDEMARRLRRELSERIMAGLGMPQIRVHLVGPHLLTRTTSGKWQRLRAAERLRDGRG